MSEQVATPLSGKPKGRWRTAGILSFVQMIEHSEGGLINSLFPVIRANLGLSLGDLGLATSIGKLARMVCGPLWAMLGDRFGRKLILVITALWGIFTIAAGLAQSFSQLIILYAIGVFGTVAGEPIANGLVADLFKADERGKVYGAMRSVTGLGFIVVTPLLGQLANLPDYRGWRIGMFILGGIGVLSGIATWLFVIDPSARPAVRGQDPFRLAHVPRLLAIPTVALLGVQLIFVTSLILFAFQVTFLVDVRHYKTAEATIITAVFFVGFTVSSLFGGWLGDFAAQRNPRTGRILLMQLSLLAFAAMSYLALQIDWRYKPVEYAVWLVFGLVGSLGFSGAVMPMVATVVLPQYRSTAFALLFSFIQGAFGAALSLAIGRLAKQLGLRLVMLLMVTTAYALNAVFWFAFYRVYPRDMERMRQQLGAPSRPQDG